MWYFAWILGVSLAVLLASMAAMMCDAKECAIEDARRDASGADPVRQAAAPDA